MFFMTTREGLFLTYSSRHSALRSVGHARRWRATPIHATSLGETRSRLSLRQEDRRRRRREAVARRRQRSPVQHYESQSGLPDLLVSSPGTEHSSPSLRRRRAAVSRASPRSLPSPLRSPPAR